MPASLLAVNQNMRFDQSVRAMKSLLDNGALGDVVLGDHRHAGHPALDAVGQKLPSLSTFVMSIHHLDTFRYWFGTPDRVLASTRPDPRTTFPHTDGINLYILEYDSGARATSWDDVWAGPAREGAAADIGIRWRVEGTKGMARGTIGWPSYPARTPSTLDYTVAGDATWQQPRWDEVWFPDAFVGTMAQLLVALEDGHGAGDRRAGQPGDGRAVRGGVRGGEGTPGDDGAGVSGLSFKDCCRGTAVVLRRA